MLLLPTFFSPSVPNDLDLQEDHCPDHPIPNKPFISSAPWGKTGCTTVHPSLWSTVRAQFAESACNQSQSSWLTDMCSSMPVSLHPLREVSVGHLEILSPEDTDSRLHSSRNPSTTSKESPAGAWSSLRNFRTALNMAQPTFLSRLNGTYHELNCIHPKLFCWIPKFHSSELWLYLEIRLLVRVKWGHIGWALI